VRKTAHQTSIPLQQRQGGNRGSGENDAGQAERVLQAARRSRAYHRLASTTDPEFHLTTELLAARLGVTIRSVDRWARDPRLEFPSPDLVVFRRKYWKRATIEAWEERRRAAAAA